MQWPIRKLFQLQKHSSFPNGKQNSKNFYIPIRSSFDNYIINVNFGFVVYGLIYEVVVLFLSGSSVGKRS